MGEMHGARHGEWSAELLGSLCEYHPPATDGLTNPEAL